jgi:MFS family permease
MESPIALFRRLTLVPQGIVVVVSSFLPIFAIVSMFPALPSLMAHFAEEPNARTLVPWMVTAPGLSIALLAPFAGYLVDRFGRVPLLTWSTLFYGIFGIAPFFLDDLYQIFATRLLLGACEACILTVVNTLIGDYWDDEGRRDWLTLQGAVGPIMGAVVIRTAGPVTELQWNGVFLIYAVAFAVFVVMKLYLFEPRKPGESRPAAGGAAPPAASTTPPTTSFPVAPMAFVAAVTLFSSIIYYMYMVKGALVFNAVGVTSPSRISELAALPSLMVMVGAIVFRMLGSKPNGVQLGAFLAFMGVGLFVMGIASDVTGVVVGIVIQQLGIGMSIPAMIAWTQTKLTFAHRGRGMGIWASCFFLGQFLSPWLGGLVENVTGSVQGAFAVAGIAATVAAVIGFGFALLRRPAVQPAGAT